jgi:hypothetical protein
MPKPPFDRFKIFKTGATKNKHVPVVSDELIERVFSATKDKSPKEIPLVLGVGGRHPSDNLPLIGYADRDSLELSETPGQPKTLSIKPLRFAEDLKSAMKNQGVDKVSILLPPGEDFIEHIAFLSNPAVELGTAFGADDEQGIAFGFDELGKPLERAFGSEFRWEVGWRFRQLGDWLQTLRDNLIADKGVEEANKRMPQYQIDNLKSDLPEDQPVPTGDVQLATGFSEQNHDEMKPYELAALQARAARADELESENATLKTDKEALARKLSDQQAEELAREVKAFCDANATRLGKERDIFEGILLDLYTAKPRAFSAADGTTQERSSYNEIKRIIAALPEKVALGEVAVKGKGFGATEGATEGETDLATETLVAQYVAVRK